MFKLIEITKLRKSYVFILFFLNFIFSSIPILEVFIVGKFLNNIREIEYFLWFIIILVSHFIIRMILNLVNYKFSVHIEECFSKFSLYFISKIPYFYYENEDFHKEIYFSKDIISKFKDYLKGITSLFSYFVMFLGYIFIVSTFVWYLGIVVLILFIPIIYIAIFSGKLEYESYIESGNYFRRAGYFTQVLINKEFANERKSFEYYDFIKKKWRENKDTGIAIERKVLFFSELYANMGIILMLILLFIIFSTIIILGKNSITFGLCASLFSSLLVFSMIVLSLPKNTYTKETKANVETDVKISANNFLSNANEKMNSQKDSIKIPMDVGKEDTENTERYVVLIIDSSEKMNGKPFELEKQTALKFCESILNEKGKNYVSIVGMGRFNYPQFYTHTKKFCHFTDSVEPLKYCVEQLSEQIGHNNMYHSLLEAKRILDTAGKEFSEIGIYSVKNSISAFETDKPKKEKKIIKDIVLLSNGVPTRGKNHVFPENLVITEEKRIEFANDAEDIADKLKKEGIRVHTLGYYQNLNVKEADFGKYLMKTLANGGYNYTIEDADKIEFVFGEEDLDPIIIIPGIMGSRLYTTSDNERIWEPKYNNLYKVRDYITGDLSVNKISNQQKKSPREREYGAKESYKKIVDELCSRFPNRAIYVYSYDWRKSNSESAEKLNTAINKVLKETGKKKVDIVAHSMGGLVTSSYYSKYGNNKLDKVITCGTPYEGSAKVFNVIMNWDVLGENILSNFDDILDGFLGFIGFTKK